MNYNLFVMKFFLFILLNFLFIFQAFFSLNFFFSSKIDEELVICFAIFFVFVLFINHIVNALQDMLKSRIENYVSVFLLCFKLIKKAVHRFKKHNSKTNAFRHMFFHNTISLFFSNLSSFAIYQTSLNNYLVNFRLKLLSDSILAESELRSDLFKKFYNFSYNMELKYFFLVNFLFY